MGKIWDRGVNGACPTLNRFGGGSSPLGPTNYWLGVRGSAQILGTDQGRSRQDTTKEMI